MNCKQMRRELNLNERLSSDGAGSDQAPKREKESSPAQTADLRLCTYYKVLICRTGWGRESYAAARVETKE